MPAPPHPGRGGGPGKGSSLHRCCRPRTAGKALEVEVGLQGPDPAGTLGAEDRSTWALLFSKDSGEGILGPGPVLWAAPSPRG